MDHDAFDGGGDRVAYRIKALEARIKELNHIVGVKRAEARRAKVRAARIAGEYRDAVAVLDAETLAVIDAEAGINTRTRVAARAVMRGRVVARIVREYREQHEHREP